MADQCPNRTSGNCSTVKPHLFVIEVQDDQDGVPIQEEVKQQLHDNELPIEGNSHEQSEGDEDPVEDNENKDEILCFEDEREVNDDDEPIAYLGVMRKDEGSSEDEYIVHCAMMYEESDLAELEEMITSHSIQGEWDWSCQYGAMHKGDCEECSLRVQHVGQDLHQMNALLNEAIRAPERYTEQEFQRGIDIGTRTRQEPSGSADECLHAASHMMAF
jgi:hypothetical protein